MPRSANPATKAKAPAPLLAWHGDATLKKATVAEMAAHRKADNLRKGFYWEGGKGCAVMKSSRGRT